MNAIKIGLDLGMSSSKLVGKAGGLLFFNQASLASGERMEGNLAGMKSRRRPMVVSGPFGQFYVGKDAHDFGQPVESFDFDHLTGTNEMRALVYGALTAYQKKFGEFAGPLTLVVGLPLQLMMGSEAKRNQAAVMKWLNGHHEWEADGEAGAGEVEKVLLAPQALGALFDYVFDMKGQAIAGREEALRLECAEISIGSNSVELMVTKRNSDTERFNGGKAVGVRKLFQRVDPKGLYTYGELDMLLRSGDLDVKEHIASWSIDVKDFINKKWEGAHERFHRVFIVGGGAILLGSHLTSKFNGHAVVLDDPVMAIAQGLYKLSLVNK